MFGVKIYLYLRFLIILLRNIYVLIKLNKKQTVKFLIEYWNWELIKSGNIFFALIFILFLFLYKRYVLSYSNLDISNVISKLMLVVAYLILLSLLIWEIHRFYIAKTKIQEINDKLSKLVLIKNFILDVQKFSIIIPGIGIIPRIVLMLGSLIVESFIDIFTFSKLKESIVIHFKEIILISALELTAFILLAYLVRN